MTLARFTHEELDELALEVLDLASTVRGMANRCREHGVDGLDLHGNKLREWLAHLEEWSHDAQTRLEIATLKHRGQRRAAELSGTALAKGRRKRKRT